MNIWFQFIYFKGWEGKNCTEDIDECNLTSDDYCYNGGTCNNLMGSFECNCVLGYSSERCEIDINECESDPCINNGVCEDQVNQYSCNCTDTG